MKLKLQYFGHLMKRANSLEKPLMLEKTFESPLDSNEIKPDSPKEINLEYSLEGLKLKLQYFGHLMQRANSLEKILMMLGKIEGRRKRG